MELKGMNLEVRGCVSNTSKKGNTYYIVNMEDEKGNPFSVMCKDASVISSLSRGLVGTGTFEISFGKFMNFELTGFEPRQRHK